MCDEHAPLSLSREMTYGLWAETRGDHEHSIFHLSDDLTYFLLANKQGGTISISFVIYLFTSHTFCRRKTPVMMSTIYLDPTDEPTYQLWANTQDTIRPSIRIYMTRSLAACRHKYEDAE